MKKRARAIETAFPHAVHQTCIVHLIRAAMRFVSWADRKALAAALKLPYTAEILDAARAGRVVRSYLRRTPPENAPGSAPSVEE